MAVVIRYFSTTSAGNRDGTSWANRARLFNSNVTVNSGTWSGPFTPGETATQTGTGATGLVELAGGSGTTLSLSGITGSPNSSGVWTGGTSAATVTPTTAPTNNAWSAVILQFAFNASDALGCRIGPGNYSCNQTLASALFSVAAPTQINSLSFFGADSSGNVLSLENPAWVSAAPVDWDSNLPVIDLLSSGQINLSHTNLELLKFTSGAGGATTLINGCYSANWCCLESGVASTFARGFNNGVIRISNSCVKNTGSSYQFQILLSVFANFVDNVRLEGNASATSGDRHGLSRAGSAGTLISRVTSINHVGTGILSSDNTTNNHIMAKNCLVANCGVGVRTVGATASNAAQVFDSFIVGSATHGVESTTQNLFVSNTRLRNNTSSNITAPANSISVNLLTAAGTDADEFVDAANGDYRIKFGSAYWGKGIGAGDEPAAGGGGWGFRRRARLTGA